MGDHTRLEPFVTIGGVAISQIAFPASPVRNLQFSVQTPHNMVPNSTMYPHIHWSPESDMTGSETAVFELRWQIKSFNNVFDGTSLAYTSAATLGGDSTHLGHAHYMTNFDNVTPDTGDGTPSRVVLGAIRREASTYSGRVFMLGLDYHIFIDLINGDEVYA